MMADDHKNRLRFAVRLECEMTASRRGRCFTDYLCSLAPWTFVPYPLGARQTMAACPEAKVVIVGLHNDEQTRDAARQAGACGYVLKENLLDLCQLIDEITYH